MQLYSGIDADSAAGQVLFKPRFVAKSWGDIRKKLEKREDWRDRGLQEFLREAQKVYVKRDEEKQRADARILVAAVKEMQAALNREKPSGKNKQQTSGPLFRNPGPTCFFCHKKGHFQNSCPAFMGTGPTCFYCHKKGHLQKSCRKKQQDEENFQED